MFLNYTNSSLVTANTYRAAGAISCGDMSEFLESVQAGESATLDVSENDISAYFLQLREFETNCNADEYDEIWHKLQTADNALSTIERDLND